MGVFGALSRVPVGAGLLAGYKSDLKNLKKLKDVTQTTDTPNVFLLRNIYPRDWKLAIVVGLPS